MTTDEGPLSRTYGHPVRLKIVDTLLANPDRAVNVRELADAANVDESSVHNHKDFLVDVGILERVSLGRIDGYQLADSELAEVGQRWRELHRQRLDKMNLETAEAIADFYGIDSD